MMSTVMLSSAPSHQGGVITLPSRTTRMQEPDRLGHTTVLV